MAKEEMYTYEGWTAPERKMSWLFADVLKQAIDSGLGNIVYFI